MAGKSFRLAKRWYLYYLLCQIGVLCFAVLAILTDIGPNRSAVITFVTVLAIEFLRWRSDYWKLEGEWAKQKWEAADGLGIMVDGREVSDWLAGHRKGFLDNVKDSELSGSIFASVEHTGPRRLVENTEESAWWSKHLSRRMVFVLAIVVFLALAAGFAALAVSISGLKGTHTTPSGAVVQSVGGIICAVLAFIFSINIIRLLLDFLTFASEAERILVYCAGLLKLGEIKEFDALSVMHDYHTARIVSPLLPTFAWTFWGDHLRTQWANFRPKPE